jgi:hypothetical protein
LDLLYNLTGQSGGPARKQLGLFLKDASDDCSRVYQALLDCTEVQPIGPVAWIRGRLRPKANVFGSSELNNFPILDERPVFQIIGGNGHD